MGYGLIDLELTEPLPRLRLEGRTGVGLIMRRKGRVLGFLMKPLSADCELDQAMVAQGNADEIHTRWVQECLREELRGSVTVSGLPSLTLAVCTKDRPDRLRRCLTSLLQLKPESESRKDEPEILVVDNAPSDGETQRVVAQFPGVRYVIEPRPGLDIARNTGVCCTQGDIVAFVDDDVTVHPAWANRLSECFSDSQVMAATGLVLPRELETESQRLFEQYWGFNRGYHVVTYDTAYFEKLKPWDVPVWEIGAGANMVFRRKAFDRVGHFDVRLDVGAAGCSGDSELWYRLLAAGLICRYEPRMTAFHDHRRDMVALRHQLYSYMRGHTAALLVQFAKHKHWGNLVRLLILLPWHYAHLVAQGPRHGFQSRHRLMPCEWAGCLAGVYFFLRHMRSPPIDKAPLDKPS